jgi:hypothetical protein
LDKGNTVLRNIAYKPYPCAILTIRIDYRVVDKLADDCCLLNYGSFQGWGRCRSPGEMEQRSTLTLSAELDATGSLLEEEEWQI